MIRRVHVFAALLFVCACGPAPESTSTPTAKPEPVVVYASFEDEEYLPSLLASFTEESGIPVTVRHRREEQIVAEVIDNRGSPPADLLLTRAVHGVWQAADEGALRPLQIGQPLTAVPEWLRDPDGYWTATRFTPIVVIYDAAVIDSQLIATFSDLGRPEFEAQLCLSAPWNAANRNLIANLIATEGTRLAETIVRGWVANLALPAFDSEEDLIEAIAAGRCALGIVTDGGAKSAQAAQFDVVEPLPVHHVVEAAGVGRHARYPDNARMLVEWLIGLDAQEAHARAPGYFPSSQVLLDDSDGGVAKAYRNAGVAGAFDADALLLAERAGWR